MDPVAIYNLLQAGGPVGMAAVFVWLWHLERKDRKAAEAELLKLATASIESSTRTGVALNTLCKLIDQ